jgi:hypothetical protein
VAQIAAMLESTQLLRRALLHSAGTHLDTGHSSCIQPAGHPVITLASLKVSPSVIRTPLGYCVSTFWSM